MKIEETSTFARGDYRVRGELIDVYDDADILCDGASTEVVTIISYHPRENVLRYAGVILPIDPMRTAETIRTYWDTYPLESSVDFSVSSHFCSFLRREAGQVLKDWMISRGYVEESRHSWILGDFEE